MRGKLSAVMMISGLALFTEAGATTCDLRTLSSPEPVAILFEPFDETTVIGKSVIELRNESEADQFELLFRSDYELSSAGGFEVELEPSETGGPLDRIDEDRFRLHLPVGETAKLTFNALVSHNELPPPGVISVYYELEVVNAVTRDLCLQALTLPVEITTKSRAQLNIAGAAGAYTEGPDLYRLDFGSLTTGMTRQVFLQVRANGDATLSFHSKNKGRLAHTEMPEFTIPYRFQVSGYSLNLDSTATIPVPPARSFRGISLPVDITIGEVDRRPGNYEDIVTITISAL